MPTPINERFDRLSRTPSDINEHMKTLYKLAQECERITEFGTRHGVSTTAFLAAKPKIMHCYDIDRKKEVDELEAIAGDMGVEFFFHQQSTSDPELLIDECNMLFVDTLHTYKQVVAELAESPKQVNKYLVFHDTELFGYRDEIIQDDNPIAKRGINAAISEFMERWAPDWKIKAHYKNNCGLTVLERTG